MAGLSHGNGGMFLSLFMLKCSRLYAGVNYVM